MKKKYITPVTEDVNVRLFNSVLGDPSGYGRYSHVTAGGDDPLYGDAKKNDLFFETDGSFGDIWDDGDNSSNPYDLWGE